jgi:hypothetical protein
MVALTVENNTDFDERVSERKYGPKRVVWFRAARSHRREYTAVLG